MLCTHCSPSPSTFACIAPQLSPAQEVALARLRAVSGYHPKQHWEPSELHDASEAELLQIAELWDRVAAAGLLEDPENAAFCGDLTLLRYLRARDHKMGALRWR